MDVLGALADWLDPPPSNKRIWNCGIPGCDGQPHPGAHWCEHPLDNHPTGDIYWRCRHARPEQLPPPGDWRYWMIQAGRGWGKTRTGAEWLAEQTRLHPGNMWAIAAPTFKDLKLNCFEGESGILAALDIRIGDPRYNRSDVLIRLDDDTVIRSLTAERPDGSRGPNLAGAWLDELSSWSYPATWYEGLMPALRRGDARVVITTTPKPKPLIREFTARTDGTAVITRGSTFDNAANLSPAALDEMRRRLEGTRLGRQELYGELLEDVDGALWTLAGIDADRIPDPPADMVRVVVAIDPAGGSSETNDETGIVVAGKTRDEHGYILDDQSGKYTPDGWARRAISAYERHNADRIIAEKNYGGDMVAATLRAAGFKGRIDVVTASRGKQQRAEPIAAMYEQHRIHHVGSFPALEDQMAMWVPESGTSPDRMDALVWALTGLIQHRISPAKEWLESLADTTEPAASDDPRQPVPAATFEDQTRAALDLLRTMSGTTRR